MLCAGLGMLLLFSSDELPESGTERVMPGSDVPPLARQRIHINQHNRMGPEREKRTSVADPFELSNLCVGEGSQQEGEECAQVHASVVSHRAAPAVPLSRRATSALAASRQTRRRPFPFLCCAFISERSRESGDVVVWVRFHNAPC